MRSLWASLLVLAVAAGALLLDGDRPARADIYSWTDADGVVHVGLFNGGGVARFSPTGESLEMIRLPVVTCTKSAFGGDDLRDLYCTTAWLNNADKRAEQPTLGGLYRVRVDRPGQPQTLFRW